MFRKIRDFIRKVNKIHEAVIIERPKNLGAEYINKISQLEFLTVQQCFDLLCYTRAHEVEMLRVSQKLRDLKQRFESLEKKSNGYSAIVEKAFATTAVKDDNGDVTAIFTSQEIEGHQIIFRMMGDS